MDMNKKYILYLNGTVMIHIKCSENPYRINEEGEISIIMAFLGRVEQRLHDILSDTRGNIVPPVSKWILTGCDVNKDIEIDGITQLALPTMQMTLVEKAPRAYVRAVGDKAYLRTEKFLTPNKPMPQALEKNSKNMNLNKNV
jgi:hypothetical protein